jgi:hypothetical protein
MDICEFVVKLLYSGLGNLAAYLAAHVLLCLVPAFYIAGAMTALVPKESITRFLGRKTPKLIAYPSAALAGSVLAVCSCTIVPLFAGIYKKGAGIGPAITFLFFAPAANILALIYTGGVIGVDLALARLILSLIFGIGVGLIMALLFSNQDIVHDKETDAMFSGSGKTRHTALLFLLLLVVLLLAGTFKFDILTHSYAQITLPISGADRFQDFLFHLVPYDSSKGQEGVSVQGVILIGMLILIGAVSWKGIETIHDGFNTWTWIAMGLVGFTLLVAALGAVPHAGGLDIRFTGRFFAVFLAISVLSRMIFKSLAEAELRDWLWESWRFVKQIFPLLVIGVFGVGVIRELIKPEWIESLAGNNTILGNLAGVLFGVFMYFPTLVEVPIANMFLNLGMHRGPLLAYLMADPELSLQSILMISVIIGRIKAWTYVGWVALFSALAGLIYGAWIDGVSLAMVGFYLFVFVSLLGLTLWLIDLRKSVVALPQKI